MRQLWADPITGKRDWVPIRLMTSDNVDRDEAERRQPGRRRGSRRPGRPEPEPGAGGFGGGGFGTIDGNVGLGPIRGVRSRSREEAIKVQSQPEPLRPVAVHGGAVPDGGGVPQNVGGAGIPGSRRPSRMSAKWIGRPMRQGLQPPGMQQPGMPNPQKPPQ